MKKLLVTIACAAVTLGAGAQTYTDAYNFTTNEYGGTARSIGMGNAMTAVGGDLGSLTFNPAGSAVAGYGQFTISPGLTISSTRSMGTPLTGESSPYSFGDNIYQSKSRMTMPNIGFVLNYDLHRNYGLKSISFGFVGNQTNNFLHQMQASGSNANTSFAGFLAAGSEGIPYGQLMNDSAYDGNVDWRYILGYQSGLTATYGGYNDAYIGVTERLFPDESIGLAGDINQQYGRLVYGNKYDYLLNFGANFSDMFYLGANLGLATITYTQKQNMYEQAVNPDDFGLEFDDGTVLYFDDFNYRYNWTSRASGVYLKVGFIAKPLPSLRIGAAIQTPTWYTVEEQFAHDAQVNYTDRSYTRGQTPEGTAEYRLTTPFRANAGVAITFGSLGMLSADYELCDYSRTHYQGSVYDSYYDSSFSGLNNEIYNYMGLSHTFRVGAEFKPMPTIALRAGYNLTTNPQKYDNGNYIDANRQSISFGVGYSSPGSFFMDFAFRTRLVPDEYIMAYDDYIFDGNGNVLVYSPEIGVSSKLYDAVLTFGWRF